MAETLSRLERERGELEAERNNMSLVLDGAQGSAEASERRIRELEGEKRGQEAEAAKLREELRRANERCSHLEAEKTRADTAVQELQGEVETWKGRAQSHEQEKAELQAALAKSQTREAELDAQVRSTVLPWPTFRVPSDASRCCLLFLFPAAYQPHTLSCFGVCPPGLGHGSAMGLGRYWSR